MATQCCSRTLHWRESKPWPWCWIFSWTGKARPESHTTEPWKNRSDANFKPFFYCYVIIVSPNVHFSLIKLNSSSHLCQNNPSSFSWLTHKMLWTVTCSAWEDISCLVLSAAWTQSLACGAGVSIRAGLCWENHVWKQEDTQQPQFHLEFTVW